MHPCTTGLVWTRAILCTYSQLHHATVLEKPVQKANMANTCLWGILRPGRGHQALAPILPLGFLRDNLEHSFGTGNVESCHSPHGGKELDANTIFLKSLLSGKNISFQPTLYSCSKWGRGRWGKN